MESTRNGYNLNVDKVSDNETYQLEGIRTSRGSRIIVENNDFYSELDSDDFYNNGSEESDLWYIFE